MVSLHPQTRLHMIGCELVITFQINLPKGSTVHVSTKPAAAEATGAEAGDLPEAPASKG